MKLPTKDEAARKIQGVIHAYDAKLAVQGLALIQKEKEEVMGPSASRIQAVILGRGDRKKITKVTQRHNDFEARQEKLQREEQARYEIARAADEMLVAEETFHLKRVRMHKNRVAAESEAENRVRKGEFCLILVSAINLLLILNFVSAIESTTHGQQIKLAEEEYKEMLAVQKIGSMTPLAGFKGQYDDTEGLKLTTIWKFHHTPGNNEKFKGIETDHEENDTVPLFEWITYLTKTKKEKGQAAGNHWVVSVLQDIKAGHISSSCTL